MGRGVERGTVKIVVLALRMKATMFCLVVYSLSFPSRAWERTGAKLCFAAANDQAHLPGGRGEQ